MHEVLVNRLGGLSLPRKSVVRLTDRPDMTLDVYRGRKTTIQYNTYFIHSYLETCKRVIGKQCRPIDQMLHYVASDQGLHYLQTGFSSKKRIKATK